MSAHKLVPILASVSGNIGNAGSFGKGKKIILLWWSPTENKQ